MASQLATDGGVVPLIEPVKPATTLHRKLAATRAVGAPVYLVANPTRGDLANATLRADWHRDIAIDLADVANVFPTFREFDGGGLVELRAFLRAYPSRRVAVLLTTNLIPAADLSAALAGADYVVFFAPSVSTGSYLSVFPLDRTVEIGNRFQGRDRNADFAATPDEFFGNDLSTWKTTGSAGFSDFTLLTQNYTESGGQVGAIAVHLSYMRGTNMRVRHFLSDTSSRGNDGVKWGEVLKKIEDEVVAIPGRYDPTDGLAAFRAQYASGIYTNLATSKRQQMRHHLQTVMLHMVR
jgi:hypothetical protein